MRTNSETNRLMETSFEDAMIRQYKPLINVIDSQTNAIGDQTRALLAIEGPKSALPINGGEDFEPVRMYNLPRDI